MGRGGHRRRNKNAQLIVCQIMLDALRELKLSYSETTWKRQQELTPLRKSPIATTSHETVSAHPKA